MNSFNIESAIEEWRSAMSSSEGIDQNAIEELEGHLRETITELGDTSLTDEETFVIASRRLGNGPSLDREFSCVSAGTVWKRRAFWMLIGFVDISAVLLLISLIGSIGTWAAAAYAPVASLPLWSALSYAVPLILCVVGGVLIWRLLLRGILPDIVGVFGKHPVFCSIAALVTLLTLKIGSSGFSMLVTQTLGQTSSLESLGRHAQLGSIANLTIGLIVPIAVCLGLAVLGKSLLPAKAT